MAVKKDEREVKSKKNKSKTVKKITYKCEGSFIDINGISHRYHKRGFSSSEEAQNWERVFMIKAKSEIDTNINYLDLYEIYKTTKKGKIKDRSYADMDYLFKSIILPYWGKISIKKITLKKIEQWQTEILEMKYSQKNKNEEKAYSNRYIDSIQMQFKAVLRYGTHMGYVTDIKLIAFKNVKRSNEIKKEMLFWHPKEYNKFISTVDEDVYIALFSVLYWCGLRLGEALALTWNDVDLKSATINISKSYSKHTRQFTSPKTENSYRSVLMPRRCFDSVEALYRSHKQYAGFCNDRLLFHFDKTLDENSIRIKKDRWIKESDLKRIRVHDFRHSHVSLLISLGFNPFDIAKRLGHTVEMVNNVYGHWFNDAQQKMVDKLNEL